MIGLTNWEAYSQADPTYEFYFFPRVNLLQGLKLTSEKKQSVLMGADFITNEYGSEWGYDWVKIHSTAETTIRKSGTKKQLLSHCTVSLIDSFVALEGLNTRRHSEFEL